MHRNYKQPTKQKNNTHNNYKQWLHNTLKQHAPAALEQATSEQQHKVRMVARDALFSYSMPAYDAVKLTDTDVNVLSRDIKVVLCGPGGVGKTAFLTRFVTGVFVRS